MTLVKIISESIKKSDNSYFFEDYTKQARAVMRGLSKNGFVILPKEPTQKMVAAGVRAINTGNIDARVLARNIYCDMVGLDD